MMAAATLGVSCARRNHEIADKASAENVKSSMAESDK